MLLVFCFCAACDPRFRDQLLEDMTKGSYAPVLDEGIKECVPVLEWWKGKMLPKSTSADPIVRRSKLLQFV